MVGLLNFLERISCRARNNMVYDLPHPVAPKYVPPFPSPSGFKRECFRMLSVSYTHLDVYKRQEPFSPGKNIHESTHRKALEMAFEGKETISGYKALEEELTTAYELAGTNLNHNTIVATIKFLTNKRMVVQESSGIYRFIPDSHY